MGSLELWSQDQVKLAEGVTLHEHDLLDSLTGRRVTLNEVAALLVASLNNGRNIKECIGSVSKENDWDFQEVNGDFMQLLDDLDQSSLLEVKKDWKSRLGFTALRLQAVSYLMLEWPRSATRRYKPTVFSLVRACLRASRLGIFFSTAVSLALLLTLAPQYGNSMLLEKYPYFIVPLLLCLFFLSHVIAHEAGHLIAINSLGNGCSKYIFVRGSRVGIAHDILAQEKRRFVAVCGPASGLAGAQLVALCLLAVPFLTPLAFLISISGTVHLYSLFPWAADGKQIWRWKERKNVYES